MLKNKSILIMICAVLAMACAGCASKVKRIEVDKTVDLSGMWNDTDARLVAEEMITDCLRQFWLNEHLAVSGGKKPVVIVGPVANNSHEHINPDIFTKRLERELINSRQVKFVASSTERYDVRAEREEQLRGGYTNPETIKKVRMETGADFMLIGSINSIKDEVRGQSVIFYQTNLELINLENNEKAWIGQKQIKKIVKRPALSF